MHLSSALRRCRNITAPSAIMRDISRISDGGGLDQKSLAEVSSDKKRVPMLTGEGMAATN
jgi:hypothetical protein